MPERVLPRPSSRRRWEWLRDVPFALGDPSWGAGRFPGPHCSPSPLCWPLRPLPRGPALLGMQPGLLWGGAGTDKAPSSSSAQVWLCDESPFLFGLQVLFLQDFGRCPWAGSGSPGLGAKSCSCFSSGKFVSQEAAPLIAYQTVPPAFQTTLSGPRAGSEFGFSSPHVPSLCLSPAL